jgi:hypothetical protein
MSRSEADHMPPIYRPDAYAKICTSADDERSIAHEPPSNLVLNWGGKEPQDDRECARLQARSERHCRHRGAIMDRIATEEAVRLLLSAIRVRLHKAGQIAQDRDA